MATVATARPTNSLAFLPENFRSSVSPATRHSATSTATTTTPATLAQLSTSSQDYDHSGILCHKNFFWNKRFVAVQDRTLLYFLAKTDPQPKLTIDLRHAELTIENPLYVKENDVWRCEAKVFILTGASVSERGGMRFRCTDSADCERWCTAIRMGINGRCQRCRARAVMQRGHSYCVDCSQALWREKQNERHQQAIARLYNTAFLHEEAARLALRTARLRAQMRSSTDQPQSFVSSDDSTNATAEDSDSHGHPHARPRFLDLGVDPDADLRTILHGYGHSDRVSAVSILNDPFASLYAAMSSTSTYSLDESDHHHSHPSQSGTTSTSSMTPVVPAPTADGGLIAIKPTRGYGGGLHPCQINRLPQYKWRPLPKKSEPHSSDCADCCCAEPTKGKEKAEYLEDGSVVADENEGCCPICFEPYTPDSLLRILPCIHSFHCECVSKWLGRHATCPTCNTEVRILDESEEERAFLQLE